MSVLRSYSFGSICGVNELPKEVLNLFVGLVEHPEKKIEFASEIVSAGLQGRINFDSTFNIDAYEAAIRKNQKLGVENKKKKEVFLDFGGNSSDDYDEVARQGGMKEDQVATKAVEKMEDAYEELLLEDELQYAVKTIRGLQPVLLANEKVDFLYTVRQALRGMPESRDILKRLCDEYEVVAEQIQVILGSGKSFDEIFT